VTHSCSVKSGASSPRLGWPFKPKTRVAAGDCCPSTNGCYITASLNVRSVKDIEHAWNSVDFCVCLLTIHESMPVHAPAVTICIRGKWPRQRRSRGRENRSQHLNLCHRRQVMQQRRRRRQQQLLLLRRHRANMNNDRQQLHRHRRRDLGRQQHKRMSLQVKQDGYTVRLYFYNFVSMFQQN